MSVLRHLKTGPVSLRILPAQFYMASLSSVQVFLPWPCSPASARDQKVSSSAMHSYNLRGEGALLGLVQSITVLTPATKCTPNRKRSWQPSRPFPRPSKPQKEMGSLGVTWRNEAPGYPWDPSNLTLLGITRDPKVRHFCYLPKVMVGMKLE